MGTIKANLYFRFIFITINSTSILQYGARLHIPKFKFKAVFPPVGTQICFYKKKMHDSILHCSSAYSSTKTHLF